MKRRILPILLLFLVCLRTLAQQSTIKGKIKDADGAFQSFPFG